MKATAVENSNFNTAYFVTSDAAFKDGKSKGITEGTEAAVRNLVVNVATGTKKTYTSNSGAGYYTVYMDASAKIGSTTKTNSNGSYTFVATDAYNAGKDTSANSLVLSTPVLNSSQNGWQVIDGVWKYPYRISATASAEGSSSTNSITQYNPSSSGWSYINGNKPFTEGKKAAEPKSVTLSVDDTTFSTSVLTMKGTANVKLGDNSVTEFPNVSIDASKPWNSVTMTNCVAADSYSASYTEVAITDANAKKSGTNIYGCITVHLRNGKSYNRKIKIDAKKVWDAAQSSVSGSLPADSPSAVKFNDGYTKVNIGKSNAVYEGDSNKVMAGSIKIVVNPGEKTYYRKVRINASEAYESGRRQGRSEATVTVNVSSLYIQKEYIYYEYKYKYRAVCTVNGTTYYGEYQDL